MTPTLLLIDLAQRVGTMTLATVPAAVQHQAKLCILDTLGCVVAGTRTQEARLILECQQFAAPAEASVPGTTLRMPMQEAVRINGYLGDVLELNDLIGGHASIGNVTAALALAEAIDAGGAALLEAVVRGIETTWRVYSSVYGTLRPFRGMALVPVGIPSSIGAAAAAARLMGLDEARSLEAMAIAGALAGWCPAEVIFGDGGTMKPLLFGAQPAATALQAASHARAGMTGPHGLLDSALGYLATASQTGAAAVSQDSLGWGLAQPRRKLHACCGYLHSSVDALAALRAEFGAMSARVRIDVALPPYVAQAVAKDRTPLSANDARFHLQYCLALVLRGADVILPEHSIGFEARLADPGVRETIPRIGVSPDPALTHYQQCRIRVLDEHGAVLRELSYDTPRGSPGRPLGDAEVIDKFMRLVAPVCGEPAAAACRDHVMTLEEQPRLRIAALLAPLAGASTFN